VEGFEAKVIIDGAATVVRIMAWVKRDAPRFVEQGERCIWRVLFYYLKSVFEAADTGVMEFRRLILPTSFFVTRDGGRRGSEV
jgi:hypothetical protein